MLDSPHNPNNPHKNLELTMSKIWLVAVHRDCAERYGDSLADVIGRKLNDEAVH